MTIQELYDDIINKLQKGHRPLVKLDEDTILNIVSEWNEVIENNNLEKLRPMLCILDNTITLDKRFEPLIIEALKKTDDNETTIFLLGALGKHIIDRRAKSGERLDMDLLNLFKDLLNNEDPEVLEWTLRTIEGIGSQILFFKDLLKEKKPGMMAVFNKNKKASKQIIEMLEKRWNF